MSGVLPAGLSLIVDDAPRLSTSAAERVLAEVDDERRRRLVVSLQKALRNRRKKDNKKAAKSRATSAKPDAELAAGACAVRVAHGDLRAEVVHAAMRTHSALSSVCLELEGVDPFDRYAIDAGDGRAATIRRLLQECLDRIESVVAAPAARAPPNALVAPETQSIVYKFLSRLVGVGVGTIRMLRRSDVDKLERTAAVLLQTLVEERACWQIVYVPTGAAEADTLPSDVAV